MSGFSSPEFLLIVVLALVVLGPKRLPEIANKVGSWVGQARRLTRVMRRQLEEELEVDDLNQIGAPQVSKSPVPPAATGTADAAPATDADPDSAEFDAAAAVDAPRPDHIPNDDDSYSPLHADDEQEEKPA